MPRPSKNLPRLAAAALTLALDVGCRPGERCEGEPGEVTIPDLLNQMVDPDHMTRAPSPWQCSRQSSSYSRRSVTPDTSEKSWLDNDDRGFYLRVERREGRKEYVMADIRGPGAIVRIWSANPGGTLRIYIDGELVIAARMTDLLSGRGGFGGAFSYIAARGYNLYFPLTFQESAVVTRDLEDNQMYYHVGYLQFPEGTKVEPFSEAKLAEHAETIDKVAAILGDPEKVYEPTDEAIYTPLRLVAGGPPQELSAPGAGGAIREIELRPSTRDEATLQSTVAVLTFDGEETVRVPLTDLFGTGPGLNAFDTMLVRITPGGAMRSRWSMPFHERATIALESALGHPLEVEGHVYVEPRTWDEGSYYFNAAWWASGEISTRPKRDFNYIELDGEGVYAGSVLNYTNPVVRWWGEGDEKIYIDGEDFPSFFGTGTEDYYGYAWVDPTPFGRPYHAQSRVDGPGNSGRTSVSRVHVRDKIPFRTHLRFDMELWHWWDEDVFVDNTNFWYAPRGTTHNVDPAEPEDYELPPSLPKEGDPPQSGWVLRDVDDYPVPAIVEPWCPADMEPGGCDQFGQVDAGCVLVRYYQDLAVGARYELATGRPEPCYEPRSWGDVGALYASPDCSGDPLSPWLEPTNVDGALVYTPGASVPIHLDSYSRREIDGTCAEILDAPIDALPITPVPAWVTTLLQSPPYSLAVE